MKECPAKRSSRLAHLLVHCGLLALTVTSSAMAFGQNKVQYSRFEWRYHKLPHFESFYHQDQGDLPEITAQWAEEAYRELSRDFGFTHKKPIPLLVFSSPSLFEQTNVILDVIPEGVGGFTELFKNRIVIPFTGSFEEFRHVIHHETTHAFQFAILYDQFGGSILRNTGMHMPLWFAEGTAEYLSSGWDTEADMFLMDNVVFGSLPELGDQMSGYIVYKGGQSFFHFLETSRGDSVFHAFLVSFRRTRNVEGALEKVYGKELKDLGIEWQQELKRIYWPEIGKREKPDGKGVAITSHTESRSGYNLKPRISPDGQRVAFFSDIKDYTHILIADLDGKVKKEITQYGYGGYFESFEPFRSGMCWSPQSDRLAFVTKNQGANEIRIVSIRNKRLLRTLRPDLAAISSPDWSPNGHCIVFTGLKQHATDIYMYDLKTGQLRQLSNDVRTEFDPRFSRDGTSIVYAAQDTCGIASRRRARERPSTDLFLMEIETGAVRRLTETPCNERQPAFSPDGNRLAFVSDRNGINNVYVGPIDSLEDAKALTNLIGGCSYPDWSGEKDILVFSLFQKAGWDIWRIDDPGEKLLDSALAPTLWIRSQADTSVEFFAHAPLPQPSDTGSADTAASTGIVEKPVDATQGEGISETDSVGADTADVHALSLPDTLPAPAQDSTAKFQSQAPQGVQPDSALEIGDSAPVDTPALAQPLMSKPYRVRFTPDMVSVGMAANTLYGFSGQGMVLLSDILGNHRITLAGDVQGNLDEYFAYGAYLNAKRRIDFGVGALYSRYYTYAGAYIADTLYHDANIGVMFLASYPFSISSRIDFNLFYRHLDREPYKIQNLEIVRDPSRSQYSINITLPSLSYTFDNILWGITGPVNGIRAQATVLVAPPIQPTDESFASVDADFRKYFHFARRFVWANRVAFGASVPIGRDHSARRFFLGGNENWIFYTVNGKNYEANLPYTFYSDYIVPFRGWDYFDLSGTRFALLNTEFRFPFVREIDIAWPLPMQIRYINGAFFVDMGNAWNPSDQYEWIPLPHDIFGGIGLGLRINLGIFVLRYDRAWRTDWRTYLDFPKDYFSLGAEF